MIPGCYVCSGCRCVVCSCIYCACVVYPWCMLVDCLLYVLYMLMVCFGYACCVRGVSIWCAYCTLRLLYDAFCLVVGVLYGVV